MPDRDLESVAADRLQRRLARERTARRSSEEISERVTRELYDQQQRLVLLTSVANAANESSAIEPAIRIAIEAIREHCGWALGHAWLAEPGGSLFPTDIWTGEAERFVDLREATRELRLSAGAGMPGRVLERGEAVWIPDFGADTTLPRSGVAQRIGIRTAMAFPILAGSEVVGVLEFFSDRRQEPDPALLELFAQVGTELGRVAERQLAADQLLHQATHDALTGLPNRTLISRTLAEMISRMSREPGRRPAVFFIDLDGFKEVNDSLGHAAGDKVLREVAERLMSVIRPYDTLGRLGGDEFVILCDWTAIDYSVVLIAERIINVMSRPFEFDGESFLITASIGVTDVVPDKAPDQLVAEADVAMYRAKKLGRGGYEFYSEELGAVLRRRSELERALRHAAQRDELMLHFQPEVDLSDGAVVGLEALLRWNHDGAMIMPADFIPLAEETGLIVPIGAWVLNSAIRQMQAWEDDPKVAAAPWISVNLSVRQLADPNLITNARDSLEAHNADPAKLVLEVTESVILDDVEAGLTVLTELNRLGSEIAIDDFGTGYASLSYLARFPAQTLKIDRSFIGRLDDSRTRAIVTAMIELAHALDMKAVAEGIETAEQLTVLTEIGCDIGQGFYFARPMPAAEAYAVVRGELPYASLLGSGRPDGAADPALK